MLSPYQLAQHKYAQLRRYVYRKVLREVRQSGRVHVPIRITDLDLHALAAFRAQWVGRSHPVGVPVWDWGRLAAAARRRPTSLRLAIWSGDQLCGLAVGRASARRASGLRHTMSVHYMASAPGPHPLKGLIAPLVIACAVEHGLALGASDLRLVDPLPSAVPLYVSLGFTVASRGSRVLYCERRIP